MHEKRIQMVNPRGFRISRGPKMSPQKKKKEGMWAKKLGIIHWGRLPYTTVIIPQITKVVRLNITIVS